MSFPNGFPIDISDIGIGCEVWTTIREYNDPPLGRVVLHDRTKNWCMKYLGYQPQLHKLVFLQDRSEGLLLFFLNENDAMKFRNVWAEWRKG